MAVAEGRNGLVTLQMSSSAAGLHTIAEQGEWSISGISRNMIDYTAFGDVTAKYKPGMLDPGTISFSGFFDGSDSTGQVNLIRYLSSGTGIYCSTSHGIPAQLRLWANDDTSFDSYGFWEMSSDAGSEARLYITSMELGTNKDGLCSISFDIKVSGAMMTWSSSST